MRFVIKVTCAKDGGQSDWNDQQYQPQGAYLVEAQDEGEALDIFHRNIPISCLDDFEIETWKIKQELDSDSRPFFIGIWVP
jgi:hypothetical protein